MAQLEVYRIDPAAVDVARGEATLSGDEAHHLLRVRRGQPGERVMLIDGYGTAWSAQLVAAERASARLRLVSRHERWREPPVRVHLGIGLLKADRVLDAIDQCVQAGVAEITPFASERAVAGWRENRARRAERRALEAAKQCARGSVPPVHAPQPIADWCIQREAGARKLVADTDGDAFPDIAPGERVAVAVGPEGGFSEREIEFMFAHGFRRVSLGPRRCRSETAAVLAVAAITGRVEQPPAVS